MTGNTTTTTQAPSVNFAIAKIATTIVDATPDGEVDRDAAPPVRTSLRADSASPFRSPAIANPVKTPIA